MKGQYLDWLSQYNELAFLFNIISNTVLNWVKMISQFKTVFKTILSKKAKFWLKTKLSNYKVTKKS